MYVNDWTVDYGPRGREAVRTLLKRAAEAGWSRRWTWNSSADLPCPFAPILVECLQGDRARTGLRASPWAPIGQRRRSTMDPHAHASGPCSGP